MQLVFPRLPILVCFHDRSGYNAYLELFCQLLISMQIVVPLLTQGKETRVFGHPVCEMILGENSEVSAFCSGGSYVVGGSGKVVGGIEWLGGGYQLVDVKTRSL